MFSSLARITCLMRRQSMVEASNERSRHRYPAPQCSATGQSCSGNRPHLSLRQPQTRIEQSALMVLCNKSPFGLRGAITQCMVLVAALCMLTGTQAQQRTFPDFTTLVENNSAAVVNISITQPVHAFQKGLKSPTCRKTARSTNFFAASLAKKVTTKSLALSRWAQDSSLARTAT